MNALHALALILAVALFVYIVYALLRLPECVVLRGAGGVLAGLVLALGLLLISPMAQAQIVLKFSHVVAPDTPKGKFKFDHFDWGGEYYKKHGRMMPENGRDQIRKHDAILFGSDLGSRCRI